MGKKYHTIGYHHSWLDCSMYSNIWMIGQRRDIIFFIYGVITTVACLLLYSTYLQQQAQSPSQSTVSTSPTSLREEIAIPMVDFPEAPWRTAQTLSARVITSTPFARFEIHKVKTENGNIVNDWLWTDERSHVNILVHLKEEDKYMLFYQKKYGLDKAYFATVGGLFDVDETPQSCAKRELLEETGLETEELISLGKYRVQVNRGGGILHAFFAKNCKKSKLKKLSDDYEKQTKKLLTKEELIQVILAGEIGEVQWLATVATALIKEDYHDKIPAVIPSSLFPNSNTK